MQNKLIIIGGTGQNTGKTTLACKIINKFSSIDINTTGIKISTHFHEQNSNLEILQETDNFQIFIEKDTQSAKDSARMLSAGACKVFYIQAKEKFVKKAFEQTMKFIDKDTIIICESFTLGKQIRKGIKILMTDGEKNISQYDKKNIDIMLKFEQINNFVNRFNPFI